MKISSTNKIKYFMRMKADRIEEFFPGYGQVYWDRKHEETMVAGLHYPDETWEELMYNIHRRTTLGGLSHRWCPFCTSSSYYHYDSECESCPYGNIHQACDECGSSYRRIISLGEELLLYKVFPRLWYKRTIELIEGGDQND